VGCFTWKGGWGGGRRNFVQLHLAGLAGTEDTVRNCAGAGAAGAAADGAGKAVAALQQAEKAEEDAATAAATTKRGKAAHEAPVLWLECFRNGTIKTLAELKNYIRKEGSVWSAVSQASLSNMDTPFTVRYTLHTPYAVSDRDGCV
jgi:hypothetical protein